MCCSCPRGRDRRTMIGPSPRHSSGPDSIPSAGVNRANYVAENVIQTGPEELSDLPSWW